jgi:hypothetical protein
MESVIRIENNSFSTKYKISVRFSRLFDNGFEQQELKVILLMELKISTLLKFNPILNSIVTYCDKLNYLAFEILLLSTLQSTGILQVRTIVQNC